MKCVFYLSTKHQFNCGAPAVNAAPSVVTSPVFCFVFVTEILDHGSFGGVTAAMAAAINSSVVGGQQHHSQPAVDVSEKINVINTSPTNDILNIVDRMLSRIQSTLQVLVLLLKTASVSNTL